MTKPTESHGGTFRPAPAKQKPAGAPPRSRLPLLVVALLLAIAALAAFWSARRGEFLGADHALFSRSPLLAAPSAAGGAAPAISPWLPRAVTALSLAADRVLWGPIPAGFRTTSILLHVLATLLLFALCLKWSGRLWIAAAGALLFAVHPVHAETVDIAGNRGELLAAIFLFLSLLSLARLEGAGEGGSGADAGGRPRVALPVAAALLAYILATFSGPIALVLPVLIVALDLLGGGPAASIARRRGIVWLLFAAASAPAIVVSLAAALQVAPRNPWLAERAFLEGLRSVFVPFPLPFHRILGPAAGFDPLWVPAALASAAIVGAALILCMRGRAPLAAGAGPGGSASGPVTPTRFAIPRPWHLPVLLTATALFAAARFPAAPAGPAVPYPLADHSLYLASAGACWLLAGLLDLAVSLAGARTSPARERAGTVAALILAAAFGYTLSLRHAAYANDLAFFTAAAAEHPESAPLRAELARAQASRAQALSTQAALENEARAQLEQAIGSVRRLVEESPSDPALRLYLANLLRDARDLDAAEEEAREALRIDPLLASAQVTIGLIRRERGDVPGSEAAYREAIRLNPALAEAHSNLGAILAARGSAAEALAELRKAVALDPSLGDAAANLASFLLEQHKPEEAMAVLRQGLLWSETNARLHYNLGVLFQSQGDKANAVRAYENAIRLDSGYSRPKNNLATLYADMGRLDEAIALLREVVAREPGNERAHYNLGVAFRAKGDTKEAANEFAAALRINPGYTEAGRALTALVSPSGTRP